MLFSSLTFVFLFLPVVWGLHTVLPRRWRNPMLIAASLFFYAWGQPVYLPVILASITLNHAAALLVSKGKTVLIVALCANLAMLGFFKYAGFLADNVNALLGLELPKPVLALPLGISFFTFQSMSYVVDVYRGRIAVQRRWDKVALAISFFPQLIAGPIVRYADIDTQIDGRKTTLYDTAEGIRRFLMGLGKKVLVADALAVMVDGMMTAGLSQLPAANAWLLMVGYALQIYFDFSGYSDMAIGLGRIFGFRYLENFNAPYHAKSVSEFWRRWHISLGSWFRDYLYIPLGGSRVRLPRQMLNIGVVWMLTGLWYGASWNMVIWGLYHGFWVAAERLFLARALGRLPRLFSHLYLLPVVVVGWVFFRTENLADAGAVLGAMTGSGRLGDSMTASYLLDFGWIVAIGIALASPLPKWCGNALRRVAAEGRRATAADFVRLAGYGIVFLLAIMKLAVGSYSPFIYFQF